MANLLASGLGEFSPAVHRGVAALSAGDWAQLLAAIGALAGGCAMALRGAWKTPLLMACSALLAAAVAVAITSSIGDSPAGQPSSSGGSTPTVGTDAPTTPSQAANSPNSPGPTGTTGPTESSAPGERRYTLELSDKTHVDLDGPATALEGGPDFEMALDFGRLFPSDDTTIKVANDAEAVSFAGCQAATRIQASATHLSEVEDDESLCISTDQGAWVALKVTDAESSDSGLGVGDVTFSARLFATP